MVSIYSAVLLPEKYWTGQEFYRIILHANLQEETKKRVWCQMQKSTESFFRVTYPWHSEGHAEVLTTVQPEAPRRWAFKSYWIYIHSLEKREKTMLISLEEKTCFNATYFFSTLSKYNWQWHSMELFSACQHTSPVTTCVQISLSCSVCK